MRYLPILLLVCAALLASCAANGAKTLYRTPSHPHIAERGTAVLDSTIDRNLLSSLVIDYINLYRAKRNLSILTYENKASQAAFWMSDYQATIGEVSHVAKTAGMTRMGDRYKTLGGGNYACAFENAGWYPTYNDKMLRNYTYDEMARNIVDGWINSPKHHEGLIVKSEGVGYIGLGVAEGGHQGAKGVYATMDIFFFIPAWADNTTAAQKPALSISSEAVPAPKSESTAAKKKTTTAVKAKKK